MALLLVLPRARQLKQGSQQVDQTLSTRAWGLALPGRWRKPSHCPCARPHPLSSSPQPKAADVQTLWKPTLRAPPGHAPNQLVTVSIFKAIDQSHVTPVLGLTWTVPCHLPGPRTGKAGRAASERSPEEAGSAGSCDSVHPKSRVWRWGWLGHRVQNLTPGNRTSQEWIANANWPEGTTCVAVVHML